MGECLPLALPANEWRGRERGRDSASRSSREPSESARALAPCGPRSADRCPRAIASRGLRRVAPACRRASIVPASRAVGAEDQPGRFGAARADQSGQAQHFAAPHVEANVAHPVSARKFRTTNRAAPMRRGPLGKFLIQSPADHQLDEPLARHLRQMAKSPTPWPSRNTSDPVGEFENFIEPMADVDDADPLRLQIANDRRTAAALPAG